MRGAEKVGGGDLSPQAFEFSHEMRLQLVLVFSSVVRLEDSVKKNMARDLAGALEGMGSLSSLLPWDLGTLYLDVT